MNQDETANLIARSYRGILDLFREGVQDRSTLARTMDGFITGLSDDDAEQFIVHFGTFCFLVASESVEQFEGGGQGGLNAARGAATAERLAFSYAAVVGLTEAQFIDLFIKVGNRDGSASGYGASGILAAIAIEYALDLTGVSSFENKLPRLEAMLRNR